MTHQIRLTDALTGLRSLETESVPLIVTDPPYDTLEKWRNMGTTTRLKKSKQSSNEWFPTLTFAELEKVFVECFRVLKKGTHMYILCDEETGDALKPILKAIGFDMRKSLIWHKVGKRIGVDVDCPRCGEYEMDDHTPGTPGMGYPYRSQWEMVLLAQKGKRKPPENRSVRNVLTVPWIKRKGAYPTQKPHELAQTFITQSSSPGDLVLDPFAGSCSTGYAAFLEGRDFLGFDISEKAVKFAREWQSSWLKIEAENIPESPGTPSILDLFGAPEESADDT